jgi:hypothetical protein
MFTDISEVLATSINGAEAVSTSETSVNFYQTTRRNNPEDSHLPSRAFWHAFTNGLAIFLLYFIFR